MHLDEVTAGILANIKPEYAEFCRQEDGTMIVKLDKALYGLIESAKIWYEHITGSLKNMGFTMNPKEPCIWNKMVDGNQLTICIYVDDLLFTCKSEATIDQALDELKKIYGDLVIHQGKSLPYLGMEFDFSVSGQVSIKMDKYIEDLLHATETTGKADTPAADTLFQVRDVEKLSTEDKNEFHSTVASVLYMAKRARPDLLTAISFLTRRVSAPDIDDQKKLDRTLKYLNATKDYALVIRPADGFHVHAWVDASYAVHTDYKSHTGVAIGIGGGVTYAKSTVQKLNTKSSTEAEIVGVSDASGHIIWTRDFLTFQGYDVGPATLHQDNQSAMALINKGYSTSDKTRHINIRFFFIKDRVDSGEVKVVYCPTEEMLADLLTKPLQGKLFFDLRDRLLGRSTTHKGSLLLLL